MHGESLGQAGSEFGLSSTTTAGAILLVIASTLSGAVVKPARSGRIPLYRRTSPTRRVGRPATDRKPAALAHLLRRLGRCESADAAAVLADLVDLPLASVLPAADAAFLPVTRSLLMFTSFVPLASGHETVMSSGC